MKNLWCQNKNARNPRFLYIDTNRCLDGQEVDGWGYSTREHYAAVGIVQKLRDGVERVIHTIVEDGKVLSPEEKETIFRNAELAILSEQ